MSENTPDLDVEAIRARLDAADTAEWSTVTQTEGHIEPYHLIVVEGRHVVASVEPGDNAEAVLEFLGSAPTDLRRLLDEVDRIRHENEHHQRYRYTAEHNAHDTARENRKLRAELDRVIREAAADKAKMAAKLADLEAQIEAGRRVEKGEPCPECGGTVSPWRDVWGKVGFHACTTCTWPLPGPDGAPRTAPEMPRPPAEEAREYRCPWCTSDRWTSVTVEGRAMAQCALCEAIHTDLGLTPAPESDRPAAQERAGDTDTPGTGSGRGTGVAEASGPDAESRND